MPSSTVTSKGQITLPKAVRERLGLEAGDRVGFRELADGNFVLELETLDLLSLKGRVRPRVRGVSLQDMEAAVRRTATRKRSGQPR